MQHDAAHDCFRLIDHITHMFGADVEPPPWDRERTYTPDTINVSPSAKNFSQISLFDHLQ